jgi:hypothetical protein
MMPFLKAKGRKEMLVTDKLITENHFYFNGIHLLNLATSNYATAFMQSQIISSSRIFERTGEVF